MTGSDAPMPDWLAKDALDIGVYTNRLEPMLDFWQNAVGLEFDHMLPIGGGVRQHRHDLAGAVFKLNHARDPLPERAPGGLLRVIIAREGLEAEQRLVDPDGNAVSLVPPGWNGVRHWAIELAAASRTEFLGYYRDALGLPEAPDHPSAVSCGRSLIAARIDPALAAAHDGAPRERVGIRYMTVQVFKVDQEHARICAAGGAEGLAPTTLGETARISFVRDPRGNWIEISQRKSITGSLDA